MNIQKFNNSADFKSEVKEEFYKEAVFGNELTSPIIPKASPPLEDNYSLRQDSFVMCKPQVFKTEECELLDGLNESGRETKDEDFDESQLLIHEELDIKNEDVEEDRLDSKYFDPDYGESRKAFTCRFCYTGLSGEKFKNAHERSCNFRKKELNLGGSVFECPYCKLLYTREEDKNKHQAVCKKRKESENYEESATKKGEGKYCCDKCSYETQRKANLIDHIRIHDKVNAPTYFCKECSYQTIDKSALNKHSRTHSCFGLVCILCQKSFKHKHNLDAHYVSRHPDRSDKWESMITSKINECPKCLYKTIYTNNFKDHLLTHGTLEDQAQYKCKICGYIYASKRNYATHLRLHVGQLPFVCSECDKRFNRKTQLDGHIISRHSGNKELVSSVTSKMHQCEKCDFKTVYNSHFKSHLKTCLLLVHSHW